MKSFPMRCLITGGAGFIGSHLAETLLDRGHSVTVIDDLSTGRFENIQRLVARPGFRFAIDTITNDTVLDRLASESDLIFHLAAAVGVRLIVEKPVHSIETNVMGTEAVLKAAVRYRAKLLIASTSEVYGKGNSLPFREDDDTVLGSTLRNRWAYAASKMVDEFLALAYHREKDLPVVIFRLFNTVGPRQTGEYGMVIPRFVQQALRNEPLTVYGDGQQSRCFLHVQDAITAIVKLAEAEDAEGEVFNIGSREEVTMRELAERVLKAVDKLRGRSTQPEKTKASEQRIAFMPYEDVYSVGFEDMVRRVPDIEKIRNRIGWQASRSLDEALEDIVTSFEPVT